jgi:hypothetical protein
LIWNRLILNNTNWTFKTSPKEIPAGGAGGGIVRLVR